MAGYNKERNRKLYIQKIILLSIVLIFSLFLPIGYFKKNDIKQAEAFGSSCCVIEQSSGRVLHSENENLRLPMASTTKVMTAYVIIKNFNIDEIISIPKQAVGIEGSSIYLREGELFRVKELLFGLMLRSGNDSAVALALYAAGSIENFAVLMNRETKLLGLSNTNFTNPHGLDDSAHYTSAYDLAMITKAAFEYPAFREIVSTKNISIGDGESKRFMQNKNKILFQYEGGNGVKTGFTKKSGRCLVSSSTRDGMTLICVVLNRGDMFPASMAYMSEMHKKYQMKELIPANTKLGDCKVLRGKCDSTPFAVHNAVLYPALKDENIDFFVKFNVSTLTAPVEFNKDAGNIEVFVENNLLKTEKIYTIEKVEKKSITEDLKDNLKKW